MKFHLLFVPAFALLVASSFGQASERQGSVVTAIAGQVGDVLKPAKVYAKASLASKAYFAVAAGDRLIVTADAPKGWVKVKVTVGYGYLQAGAVKLGAQVELPTDQVGQITRETKVFKEASLNSTAHFSVKVNDQIVVNAGGPEGWTKVALNTGDYGYVENDAVNLLPIEVPKEQKERELIANQPRVQGLTSRGTSRGTRSGREGAAETGLDYLGTSYKWGGNDIENGIDCSGFVQQLFGRFGMQLPRTAAEQAKFGQVIDRLEDLRKGDRLYFWDSKRGKIGHTGIYLGDGKFVHSSSTHRGVAVDDIREGRWLRILVAARR